MKQEIRVYNVQCKLRYKKIIAHQRALLIELIIFFSVKHQVPLKKKFTIQLNLLTYFKKASLPQVQVQSGRIQNVLFKYQSSAKSFKTRPRISPDQWNILRNNSALKSVLDFSNSQLEEATFKMKCIKDVQTHLKGMKTQNICPSIQIYKQFLICFWPHRWKSLFLNPY